MIQPFPPVHIPPEHDRQRLLALLALTQAAALIDHLAITGSINQQAMEFLLHNLLSRDPFAGEPVQHCTDDPAGGEQLAIGRRTLADLLRQELPTNQALILTYMRAMVRLEGKLARQPRLETRLDQRLQQAGRLQRYYASQPAAVYAAVAGAYTDTLGGLNTPIPVTGALQQILNRHNGNVIRTALLGGVQAARTWRDRGGRLRQLRWQRKGLLRQLHELSPARSCAGSSE